MKLIQKIKNYKRRREIDNYYKKPSFVKILLVRGIIILALMVCVLNVGFTYLYGTFKSNYEKTTDALIDLYKSQFETAYDRYILKTDPEFLSKVAKNYGAELSDYELYDQYVNHVRRWFDLNSLYGDTSINIYDKNLQNGIMDFDKPYLTYMDAGIYDGDPDNASKTFIIYSYKSDALADELLRILPAKRYDDLFIHIDGYFVKGLEFIPRELYLGVGARKIEHNKVLQELFGDGEEYDNSYFGQTEKRHKVDTGVGSIEEMESQGYTYVDKEIYGSFGSVITGLCPVYPCTQEQKSALEKVKESCLYDIIDNDSLEMIEAGLESSLTTYGTSIDTKDYDYSYATGIDKSKENYYLLYNYKVNFWDDVFWYYDADTNDHMEQGITYKMVAIFGAIVAGLLWVLMTFVLSITAYQKKKGAYDFYTYQRDLTNIMAHDLKSPLMVIRGSAENLQDEMQRKNLQDETKSEKPLDETQSENLQDETQSENLQDEKKIENDYARTIIEESDYMSGLISRILSLSKLESNQAEMKKEDIDVKEIFDEIIEKYSDETDRREIKTVVEETGKIISIKADSFWIKEALTNLYDNAVKYCENGSEIKIKLTDKDISISNKMADPDIKDKDIKKLKERFVRGDNARSGQSGNGLGLSIAESILMRNGLGLSLKKMDDNFIVTILN